MSESSISFNADDPDEQILEALREREEKVIVLYLPGRLGGVAINARYFTDHPELT